MNRDIEAGNKENSVEGNHRRATPAAHLTYAHVKSNDNGRTS